MAAYETPHLSFIFPPAPLGGPNEELVLFASSAF